MPHLSKIQDAFREKFVQGSILHHFLEVAEIRYAWAQDSFLSADTGHTLGNKHPRNPCKHGSLRKKREGLPGTHKYLQSHQLLMQKIFRPPLPVKGPFPFRHQREEIQPRGTSGPSAATLPSQTHPAGAS